MRLGFVIPWFGMDIPGGAEAALRGLVLHLSEVGVELEVLTTCVKEFSADWNTDFHKPGLSIEQGIPVRRFRVRKRHTKLFDRVNAKLIDNAVPLSDAEESVFVRENINSPELYQYLRDQADNYDLFVFTPYLFGTTYYGIEACPEKAVMIPCLHEESYVHLRYFKQRFEQAAGMIFLSRPEYDLACRIFALDGLSCAVLGTGVYEVPSSDAARFREKYGIDGPFFLYAGRKDVGKNVPVLVQYFAEYRRRHVTDLKLVLIGGGEVTIPSDQKASIVDLGFLPVQDKYDAYRAATLLCQPSPHESFSLVIMESWLSDRPVLVSADCAVTKDFVRRSNGGLYFGDYHEFEGAVDWVMAHPEIANQMGLNGHAFVHTSFSWNHVVEVYTAYFQGLIDQRIQA